MPPKTVFALIGGLLVLAFGANRLFRRTRVPDVLVLMFAGVVVGPILGLVGAEQFKGLIEAFGTLAVILILFEGGLELDLRRTLKHFPGGILLTLLAFGLSLGLVATLVWWNQGLPATASVLVAAVFSCTSSAIVLPVLQQMQVREPVKVMLLLEASLGDVFAVLIVEVLLDLLGRGGPVVSGFLAGFVTAFTPALIIAMLAGVVWSRLLPILSEQRFWHVLTFSVVLLLYAGTEAMGASGLIAVLAFGLTLSNFPGIDARLKETTVRLEAPAEEHHLKLLNFHSELAFLVRTFFFTLIGVVVDFRGLKGNTLLLAGVLAALFLGRWIAVQVSRRAWRQVSREEAEVILWILPRGLITAVLAIQAAEVLGSRFAFLPALAFAVILATNLIVVLGSLRAKRQRLSEGTGESKGAEALSVQDGDAESAPAEPASSG